MIRAQPKCPSRVTLIATDDFSHVRPSQIHHHYPARPENMDMGRRMIIGIDREPEAIDTQHHGHSES
jgi:hypothetical protein